MMEDSPMLQGAKTILSALNEKGFEAYIVGGYVRDRLLGIEGNDIDITTNAIPEAVQEIFPDNFSKSLKYKTINVRVNGFEYEITTYRVDQHYSDHRHPRTKVSSSLRSDIKRRDFTVNALCMDKDMNIVDYVGGKEDLSNHIIRAVGIPYRRFKEDALRIFRAFRFAARLDFTVEPETYNGIVKNAGLTKNISRERIRTELEGTISAKYFRTVLPVMIESNIYKSFPDLEKAFKVLLLNYRQIDLVELLALASYLAGKPTDELLLSKKEKNLITDILHFTPILAGRALRAIDLFNTDFEPIERSMEILDIVDQHPYKIDDLKDLYHRLPIKTPRNLAINGNDLKVELKISDSPDIKKYLEEAESAVIYEKCSNEKDALIAYLKELGK